MQNNLQRYIKSLGYTQDELAKALDMQPQNVSRMLKNDDFKLSVLEKLATFLKVDLSFLINIISEKTSLNPPPKHDIWAVSEPNEHYIPLQNTQKLPEKLHPLLHPIGENAEKIKKIVCPECEQKEREISAQKQVITALQNLVETKEKLVEEKERYIQLLEKQKAATKANPGQNKKNKSA